jgi:hypothetical protein
MAPERTSYIPPISLRVTMCIPSIVARQLFGKNVTAAMNTQTRIEEMLDASFSMRSVSCQRRVGGSVCVFPYRC